MKYPPTAAQIPAAQGYLGSFAHLPQISCNEINELGAPLPGPVPTVASDLLRASSSFDMRSGCYNNAPVSGRIAGDCDEAKPVRPHSSAAITDLMIPLNQDRMDRHLHLPKTWDAWTATCSTRG